MSRSKQETFNSLLILIIKILIVVELPDGKLSVDFFNQMSDFVFLRVILPKEKIDHELPLLSLIVLG